MQFIKVFLLLSMFVQNQNSLDHVNISRLQRERGMIDVYTSLSIITGKILEGCISSRSIDLENGAFKSGPGRFLEVRYCGLWKGGNLDIGICGREHSGVETKSFYV